MKKILTYENRKQDATVWDVSTPKLELKAKAELFTMLDEDWQMFIGIEKYTELSKEKVCPTCQHKTTKKVRGEKTFEYQQYLQAKKGDDYSINEMLNLIKNDEYGSWHITELQ